MKVSVTHARAVVPWTSVVVHIDVQPFGARGTAGVLAEWVRYMDAQRARVTAIAQAIAERVRLPRPPRVMRTRSGVQARLFVYCGKPRDADKTRLSKVKRLAERELAKLKP